MSTIAYAQLTNFREMSAPGTSTIGTGNAAGGIKTYSDALTALVPAEILTVHALVISVTTKTENQIATVTDAGTLKWAFWGLLLLSILIYAIPRATGGKWDNYDYLRMLIAPLAFVGWTMLQPTSAFSAVASLATAPRTVAATFLAIVLGLVATALAYKADAKPAPGPAKK